MAIVSTAKKDMDVVAESKELLNFVKERTLDKKFKIRKEAVSGLALIYKKHLNDSSGKSFSPEPTNEAMKEFYFKRNSLGDRTYHKVSL